MKNQKKKSFPLRVFLCLLAVLLAVYVAFGVYVNDYYHADPAAEDALVSDDVVSVTEQNGNWVFAPESPTARADLLSGRQGGKHRRGTATADSGCAGGVDESSIKAKYPDHFPVCHRRMAGTILLFREPALNTNGTYG